MNKQLIGELALQIMEAYGRTEAQYVPGKTMPPDISIAGNIVAWDDYVRTLAKQQLATARLDIDANYSRCIHYFRSSMEKMNIFRKLYLLNDENTVYTISQLSNDLNVSRVFVNKVLKEATEEGFTYKNGNTYVLTELGVEAFRHYATNWWMNNQKNGLAAAFFRLSLSKKL